MSESTDSTTPRSNSALRWVPWIGAVVVVIALLVVFRPAGESDSETETPDVEATSAQATAESCEQRQLPGSDYGPCKSDPSDADNGGSTAPGVTEDTVAVTFRVSNPAQLAALEALAGDALASLGGDQDATVSDLENLVAYFNENFELHGRQVVLDVFEGQGEFLAEFQGDGVQGAQIDAARARDLGAFADVSLATMTQPYAEALAAEQIVLVGPVFMSEEWYEERAPYAYGGAWPVGTDVGEFAGNVACEQLAGRPAEHGGSDVSGQPRTFGVVHPENPEYVKIAEAFESTLSSCGESVGRTLSYAIDLASAQQNSVSAMAQLKDAGVTTVVCFCDSVYPSFLTQAADQQQYEPEWLVQRWPDPWGRLAAQDQWSHAMELGGQTQPLDATEVGTAVDAATDGAGAESPESVGLVYQQLLVLFSALQQAGPELTAESFAQGLFELPATESGVFGPWSPGQGVYNLNTSFQLGWWSPEDQSALDGTPGSVQNCGEGTWLRFDDPESMASDGTQPGCFQ